MSCQIFLFFFFVSIISKHFTCNYPNLVIYLREELERAASAPECLFKASLTSFGGLPKEEVELLRS